MSRTASPEKMMMPKLSPGRASSRSYAAVFALPRRVGEASLLSMEREQSIAMRMLRDLGISFTSV